MKDVVYGYRIRQNKHLLSSAQEHTHQLTEVLGQSAPLVSVEWDRSEDARGKEVLTLRLSDFAGSVTTVFEPRELESPPHMRDRFYRLWGDLLQVRSQQQLQQLQGVSGPEGG